MKSTAPPANPISQISIEPIGFVRTEHVRKWQLPRQPGLQLNSAVIDCRGTVAREALEDLAGFERIWVIFIFHRAGRPKAKVRPPRGECKRGVLATRTPHHPNALGLSCVRLTGIEDFAISIVEHDLLDGTPVVDIKPYIPYCDSFEDSRAGWVDELGPEQIYSLYCSELVKTQLDFLADNGVEIYTQLEAVLSRRPHPYPNHRVEALAEGRYCFALQEWRCLYTIEGDRVVLQVLQSGYTVVGEGPELHRRFAALFAAAQRGL